MVNWMDVGKRKQLQFDGALAACASLLGHRACSTGARQAQGRPGARRRSYLPQSHGLNSVSAGMRRLPMGTRVGNACEARVKTEHSIGNYPVWKMLEPITGIPQLMLVLTLLSFAHVGLSAYQNANRWLTDRYSTDPKCWNCISNHEYL